MTAVRQLHYTSCRHGQGKGSGFQVRACSEGIDDADKAELVRLGLHTPPDTSSATSGPESGNLAPPDDSTPCPPALRVFTLPSGCRAVQRSVYAGCDYSGREGNFFTHSLIFPKTAEESALPDPFELLHWPGWMASAEAAGGDTSQPAPLPELTLEALADASAGDWSIQRLADALQQEPARRSRLEALLGWLCLPADQRRPLILQDAGSRLVFWLACLWRALPETTTRELAFSTYQGEPTSRFHVVGTTPGTRFDALPPRVFVFCDLLTGEIPSLPAGCDEALEEAQRLVRRLLGRSLDPATLRDELATLDAAEGLRRLLLLHAARHDVTQAEPAENVHAPVWHRAPLCELGLAYAAAEPRRLCALLALLPPTEGAAWLRAASDNASEAFIGALCAALPLLVRINPVRAQELREALR